MNFWKIPRELIQPNWEEANTNLKPLIKNLRRIEKAQQEIKG